MKANTIVVEKAKIFNEIKDDGSLVYLCKDSVVDTLEVDDDDDEEKNTEPYDIDSDMGFDPYMGSFSFDC